VWGVQLLLCGLPTVDVDDWKRHTVYRGEYEARSKVIRWFWQVCGPMLIMLVFHSLLLSFIQVVTEFTDEQRARLLQFVTGTSRVPVAGFGALQGYDGSIRQFAIESIALATSVFPKAHTCFNVRCVSEALMSFVTHPYRPHRGLNYRNMFPKHSCVTVSLWPSVLNSPDSEWSRHHDSSCRLMTLIE
jgi:hypothetical protein